jgi:hypothetical protein
MAKHVNPEYVQVKKVETQNIKTCRRQPKQWNTERSIALNAHIRKVEQL